MAELGMMLVKKKKNIFSKQKYCFWLLLIFLVTAAYSDAVDTESLKEIDDGFYSRVLPLIKEGELLMEKAAEEFSAKANAAKKDLLDDLNKETIKHAAEDKLEAVVEVDNARKYYESFDLTISSGTPRPKQFYRGCLIPFERSVKTAKLEYEDKIALIKRFFRKRFTDQKEQAIEELSKERQNALSQSPPDIPKAKQAQERIDAIMQIEPPDLHERKRKDSSERGNKNPESAIAPFDAQKAKVYQKVWSENLEVEIEVTNSIGMHLTLIPPGTFTMGDGSDAHQVKLNQPFMLGVHEVTQAQYERVMRRNPSKFKGPQNPVDSLSWEDAMEFCQKLSGLPRERSAGRFYRLPTEAEWEYACRAGTMTEYGFGDNESGLGQYAWYGKNSGSQTHPVGQKQPNGWGLYDMHGNVWEWCADRYGGYPSGDVTDPRGPQSGSYRVGRGGGWGYNAEDCRSASRYGRLPSGRDKFNIINRGFRVVCVPSGQ